MNEIALKLCDIQGRLFELSADHNYGSMEFIKLFMNSETAKALDSEYNRMQWAGEEYLLEEIVEAAGDKVSKGGEIYSKDFYEQLHNLLEKLPTQRREVFILTYIEGLKAKEVSERLQIPQRTVESHIYLAIKYLRAHLSKNDFYILSLLYFFRQ